MSINLHQEHYSGTIENYVSLVKVNGYIEKNSSTISGLEDLTVNFVDPVIKLNSGSFSMKNIYYLKFAVRKDRVAKNNIYVRLEGIDDSNGVIHTQDIMKFSVPSTDVVDVEDVIIFEKIFQPDSGGYNQIRFSLERSNNDLWDVRDINPTINNLVIDNLDNANNFTFQYNKNTRGKLTVNKIPDSLNISDPGNKIKLSYDTAEYSLNQYLTLYLATDENEKKYITLAFSDKENDFSKASSIPLLLTPKSNSSTGKTVSDFEETSNQNSNDWQKTTWVNNTGEDTFSGDWLMLYYYDDTAMTGKTDKQKLTLNQRNIELYTITNMFEEVTNKNTYLTKIGLQAQPGTMFTLNGAELRVGATGVYQIEYPELKINHVGVVPPARYPNDDTKNFFILDYVQVDNNQ